VITKGPGESALLLLDAVALLSREGVTHAVIGAMAELDLMLLRQLAQRDGLSTLEALEEMLGQ
jgi:hypothetical protein